MFASQLTDAGFGFTDVGFGFVYEVGLKKPEYFFD